MEVDDVLSWNGVGEPLRRPIMVVTLTGWFDVAGVATAALDHLVSHHRSEHVGSIDPDPFYDFTQTRPEARLDDDEERVIVWPSNEFLAVRCPETCVDESDAGSDAFVPDAGEVDAAIDANLADAGPPDADLAGATPALTGVTFRAVSAYLLMAAGTHRLRATAAGTQTVLLDANPLSAPAGSVRTLVLGEAPGGGAPFSGVLVVDD